MSMIAIRSDHQKGVLGAKPVERLLTQLECDEGIAAGLRRTLEALGSECRGSARGDAQLRHLLVVRVRQDPDWRRWTPFNSAQPARVYGDGNTGGWWQQPELGLMGWYYDGRHATPDPSHEMTYRRSASEIVHALEGLLGVWGERTRLDPVARWTLDLYRSAWASVPLCRSPRLIRCGVANIPWESRDLPEEAGELPATIQLMAKFRGLEPGEPSCWFSLVEPDLFTASAAKIDMILGALDHAVALPTVQWRPGCWFARATSPHGLTVDRLNKARRSPRSKVASRPTGRGYEYEVASVCRYAPEFQLQIIAAWRAESALMGAVRAPTAR